MNDACATPEARRYRPWILGGAILTSATVVVASTVLEEVALDPGPRIAVALVPVVLFAGLIALMVQQVRHLDELQRKIQLEALAIAFPTACVMGLGVEYLQKAGFAAGWTIGDVWPWMFLTYVPAYAIARWRYR